METLEGVLEHITYYSQETSYLVGRLGRQEKSSVTFVGYFPSLQVGESLYLKGVWQAHPRYGRQFQVKEWGPLIPTTRKGLVGFLASGLIKGVGPCTARRLVEHFGLEILKIIENCPERLQEVPGIGPKKTAQIKQGYLRHKEIKEVMIFLQNYEVSPALAVRLFKHYGRRTLALLQENPYLLATEVLGIGFLTADKVARQLGLPFVSPQRVRAAVLFLLNRAAGAGHVFLPVEELRDKLMELLLAPAEAAGAAAAGEGTYREVFPGLIAAQLQELAGRRQIFVEKNDAGAEVVYLAPFYYAEKGTAERLLSLAERQPALSIAEEGIIQEVLAGEKLTPAPEQAAAVEAACRHGVTVITGGPGTGKTTTIRLLLKVFQRQNCRIMLAAPTGRAAKNMAETTGQEARTIHRLLEYAFVEGEGFRFQRDRDNPLPADVLILDEVSMLDLLLFYNLLQALPPGCRLILVGDVDQLPAVGAGNVLRDLIASAAVPCIRLQTIFRQARESMIVVNAHRINRGKFPFFNRQQKDFFFIREENPEKVARIIVDLCRERLPAFAAFDSLEEIQVLTPMHKTPVGVERLNRLLQQELNPPARHKNEIVNRGLTLRLGDKVMQLRNNYTKEVFNGDAGRISFVDPEAGEIVVVYPGLQEAREVAYDLSAMDELALAYAVSVHKSQGSEFPAVVMPVVTQHYILLQRNLLYTGITRAKRLVVLVGTPQAVALAIGNNKVEKRYSNLDARLRGRGL
ncbi:MAG: ATP-dependent RecD-like DNA helicase [Firmicutes bacterium]|nr:ATP-dependent RecD-like DNA helicase [Bacillota bacterium]